MPDPATITLVVPCFNEAERLDGSAFAEFVAAAPGRQVLFVDDGSSDATAERLQEWTLAADNLHQLELAQNQGKAEAVRLGVLRALELTGPEFVGYWDADLATPLDEVPRFVAQFADRAELNCVMGARVLRMGSDIQRRWYRHYLGRIFATAVHIALGVTVYDTQCGAKLFRAACAAEIFAEPFVANWLFDVELILRMRNSGGPGKAGSGTAAVDIYELPLETWHDIAGSKLRPGDFLKAPLELLRVMRAYRNS